MQAARQGRLGTALAMSVLTTALVVGCRSRPPEVAPVKETPNGNGRAASVAPATEGPPRSVRWHAHIRGRILDELGPPPAATVYVLRWKGDDPEEGPVADPVAILTPDANGEFSFDLTSEASKELRIDVAGLAPRSVWLPVTATRSPILILGTRTLRGFVRDPEGRTVAGALVRVYVSPEEGAYGHEGTGHQVCARTRSDGSYRVDRLPRGRCRVSVEETTPEGEPWFEEQHRSFTATEQVAHVDLGLPSRLPRVTVRVLGAPGGAPQRVPWLGFRSATGRRRGAKENADGTYTVRLPPGSYATLLSVAVEHDGVYSEGEVALHDAQGRPATVTIRRGAPDPTIDLYLPPK